MSLTAAELGRKLLDEVHEAPLDELLRILHADDPSHRHLNIPALDRIIDVFHAALPAARLPVVELTSTTPGSGKTHLLYYAIAVTVLPRRGPRAGKGAAAIVIDMHGCFSVSRLSRVMQTYLDDSPRGTGTDTTTTTAGAAAAATPVLGPTVHAALRHVHVMRPQSLAATIATVAHLPSYLLDPSAHASTDREIGLVALDGAAAFYWQDRHAEEAALLAAGPGTPSAGSGAYARLAAALAALQRVLACPILTTNWSLSPASLGSASAQQRQRQSTRPLFRPLLPPAWQALVTVRLCVARATVPRYPAGIGIEGARRDVEARGRAMVEKGFVGWVDRWGEEGWAGSVREGLAEAGGGWRFWVEVGGVWME